MVVQVAFDRWFAWFQRLRWLARLQRFRHSTSHQWIETLAPWGVLLTAASLALGAFQFLKEIEDRATERNVRAWQLVTAAAPGNSGKREALEYLNREGVLLQGIDLSPQVKTNLDGSLSPQSGTILDGIVLPEADLTWANLAGVFMRKADLSGAILERTNLSAANLSETNLSGARLRGATLHRTILLDAKLRGANLYAAVLTRADLVKADLRGADLREADLRGADLQEANLQEANLTGADLTGARLVQTDLSTARGLEPGSLRRACGSATTRLPRELTIDPCDE